jgi:hypothetical protein
MNIKNKTCSKCKEEKLTTNFTKSKTTNDKLFAWCRECLIIWRKQYNIDNKDKNAQRGKDWRDKTVESRKISNKKWMEDNKEKRKEYKKEYRIRNKDKINKYKRKKLKEDMKNPKFALEQNLRSRLYKFVTREGNTQRSKDLVGCTIDELMRHLENLFTEGMNWENRNKWHIDHIIPICSFDLTIEEEQKKCFHYTNLQPLWAEDNLAKGSKII